MSPDIIDKQTVELGWTFPYNGRFWISTKFWLSKLKNNVFNSLRPWSASSVFCYFICFFRSRIVTEWVCATDQATMYISEEGRLSCSSPIGQQHNDLIVNWKFDCGDRTGPHRFTHCLTPDYEGFNHAIAMAMLQSTWATAEWATKLMQNVKKQYNKNWSSSGLGV